MNFPTNPNQTPTAQEAIKLLDQERLQQLLTEHQRQLAALGDTADPLQRAALQLDIAAELLALGNNAHSWSEARNCFNTLIELEQWQGAVEACDIMYQCDQPASISALGQGTWLAVTFPVEPQTSVAMLQHIIDETPNHADGAAIAAITAHYLVHLRAVDEQLNSLSFLTTQLIAQVAKRHSGIETQEALNQWMQRLQLTEPSLFLPKLAQILSVMVDQHWWYDRDALRAKLPA